ncbi:MAG: NAD(P)H-hydrate dehydratase [Pseudomonadota bacterium]
MPETAFATDHALRLLAVNQMYDADRAAIDSGAPGEILMANAGAAIAEAVKARFEPCQTVVLCGPGNNGGDGFVVARLLSEAGWPVELALLGDVGRLKGDAAIMAERWQGEVVEAGPGCVEKADLVIDALFGAGLARDLDGQAAVLVAAVVSRGAPVVAVDVPSGLDGDSGAVRGIAPRAVLTVTFCRAKPGHVLLPGRELCGEVVVADIGIGDHIVGGIGPAIWRNGRDLWFGTFPWPAPNAHKYARGHTVVAGGDLAANGASRLAARAALRVGSGLVTVAAPPAALSTYAAHLTAIMLRRIDDAEAFSEMLADPRLNCVVLGPGQGVTERTRALVEVALAAKKHCVLDADALTVFADDPEALFARLHADCVLTPHEGEFARLFDDSGNKLDRARRAAEKAGAIVLLKGADTVIAAPDGTAMVNDNAPPDLATAGSGDVLAGVVAGLMAQGVKAVAAAAMGAWLHGEAGKTVGSGLIAEDLPEALPRVLAALKENVA